MFIKHIALASYLIAGIFVLFMGYPINVDLKFIFIIIWGGLGIIISFMPVEKR